MTSTSFEQILTAAQAEGSLNPAWRKFVQTRFFVPLEAPSSSDPNNATLQTMQGPDGQAITISEVRDRLAEQSLATLTGAEVVRRLRVDADILVALSDRVFTITKDRVGLLKKAIEAAQAKSVLAAATASQPGAPLPVPDTGKIQPPAVATAANRTVSAPVARPPAGEYTDDDDIEPTSTPAVVGISIAGRIGRLRAMAYSLSVWVPLLGAGLLMAMVGARIGIAGIGVALVALVLSILLSLRLMVLRLHDLNLSGKWILLFPVLMGICLALKARSMFEFVAGAYLLVWLVLSCLVPGTNGSNNYGAPPGPNSTLVKVGAALFIVLNLLLLFNRDKIVMVGISAIAGQIAAPQKDALPPGTVRYSPPGEGFTVNMPGEPVDLSVPSTDRATEHIHKTVVHGRTFTVQTIEFSGRSPSTEDLMQMMWSKLQHGGTGLAWKSTNVNGREVQEQVFGFPNGVFRAGRITVVGRKAFLVSVEAREKDHSAQYVRDFLDSFEVD